MIEAEETPYKNPTVNLKDDNFFNWMMRKKLRMMNRLKKNWMVDMKKITFNVRNGAFWLKGLFVGTLQSFQNIELDVVRFEYGEIVNASEI